MILGLQTKVTGIETQRIAESKTCTVMAKIAKAVQVNTEEELKDANKRWRDWRQLIDVTERK